MTKERCIQDKSIWQGPFTQAAEINKVDKSQNHATIWGITEQVPNDGSRELLWAECYVLNPSHASCQGSLRRVHEISIHFTKVETETEGDTGISPLTPEPINVISLGHEPLLVWGQSQANSASRQHVLQLRGGRIPVVSVSERKTLSFYTFIVHRRGTNWIAELSKLKCKYYFKSLSHLRSRELIKLGWVNEGMYEFCISITNSYSKFLQVPVFHASRLLQNRLLSSV